MRAVCRRQQRIRGSGFSWGYRIIAARSAELNLGGRRASIYTLGLPCRKRIALGSRLIFGQKKPAHEERAESISGGDMEETAQI